jgi:hypothetical protein
MKLSDIVGGSRGTFSNPKIEVFDECEKFGGYAKAGPRTAVQTASMRRAMFLAEPTLCTNVGE